MAHNRATSDKASERGRPFKNGTERVPCSRCGGAGGWEGWPGFTCYRCGGVRVDPTPRKAWTYPAGWSEAECAEFDAERERKLEAKRLEREKAKLAEREAAWDWNVEQWPGLADYWRRLRTWQRTEAGLAERGGSEEEWRVASQEHELVLQVGEFLFDVAHRASEGRLSAAQGDAWQRAWTERCERIEARKAEREQAGPVPTGKAIGIEGRVLKVEARHSDWGVRWVMVVKADEGWTVWGSIPKGIDPDVGDRVRFVADIEASDDPTFGFCKRPRKPELVAVGEVG